MTKRKFESVDEKFRWLKE